MVRNLRYVSFRANPNIQKVFRLFHLIFWTIISFESFFAVFLFAGVFKENPRLSWFPFDITGSFLVLSFFAGFRVIQAREWTIPRYTVPAIGAMLLLCCWAFVSLTWSPGHSYAFKKTINLTLLAFWSFWGSSVLIGPSTKRVRRFLGAVVVLAGWVSGEITILFLSGALLGEWEWASYYLGLGRLIGLGVLVLAGVLLWARINRYALALTGLVTILFIGILLVIGGRGPFLATIGAFAVVLIRDIRFRRGFFAMKKRFLVISMMLMSAFVSFVLWANVHIFLTTFDRLMQLTQGGGNSARTRFWLFEKAWQYWQTSPILGHGMGSFGLLLGWGDVKVYPHNIILEIMVELGLIGLFIFLGLIVQSLRGLSLVRIRHDALISVALMLTVNGLLNSFVSYDLPANRVFFAMLGLVAGLLSRESSSA